MKLGHLRSVAHSIADSLASGVSLITGFYSLSVYEDAARSDGGILIVDLLNGGVVKGKPSSELVSAAARIPPEFDRLCRAKGVTRDDCRSAMAHFHTRRAIHGFKLIIEDSSGRVTESEYEGVPARRVIELDRLGRVRRKPISYS